MVIHDLSEAECRELLGRTHVGRLACARANQPYIVPFFFYFSLEENAFYSFSTHGQKIDWMRGNPRVCVELDDVTDQFHWTTVVVFGRYDELDKAAAPQSDARRRAFELFQQRAGWWLPAAANLPHGVERDVPVVYRIRIDKMSGRRAARPEPA